MFRQAGKSLATSIRVQHSHQQTSTGTITISNYTQTSVKFYTRTRKVYFFNSFYSFVCSPVNLSVPPQAKIPVPPNCTATFACEILHLRSLPNLLFVAFAFPISYPQITPASSFDHSIPFPNAKSRRRLHSVVCVELRRPRTRDKAGKHIRRVP